MSDDEAPVNNIMSLFERMNDELPARTNEALTDIGSLDQEICRRNVILQRQKIEYMANYDRMTPEQRTKGFENIKGELQELLKLQDQKLEMAVGLKVKLEHYDEEFGATEADFIENVKFMEVREVEKKRLQTSEEVEKFEKDNPIPKKRGRKKKTEKAVSYCWCGLNNKDERDMIACDNSNCKIEWYHFSCVNITEVPSDDTPWYCGRTCEEEVKRNPAMKVKDKPVKDKNDKVIEGEEEEEEEEEEYQDPDGKAKKKHKKEHKESRRESKKHGTKRKKSSVNH